MDKHTDQKRAVQYLYPPIDPFDQRMMDVGQGHSIYVTTLFYLISAVVVAHARTPQSKTTPHGIWLMTSKQ